MRNRIRLNESQLHRVIKESVRMILKEYDGSTEDGQFKLGAVNGRANARAQKERENGRQGSEMDKKASWAHKNAQERAVGKRFELSGRGENAKAKKFNDANQQGYWYGFNKEMGEK